MTMIVMRIIMVITVIMVMVTSGSLVTIIAFHWAPAKATSVTSDPLVQNQETSLGMRGAPPYGRSPASPGQFAGRPSRNRAHALPKELL